MRPIDAIGWSWNVMTDMKISKNEAENRYEAHIDGKLAGFAAYIQVTGLMVFSHTEVMPEFEGQGVGSGLARFALDDVRAEGSRKVQPLCPFIRAWIERHADYHDLVER